MTSRRYPAPVPTSDDPKRFELIADRLAHGAAATALMASGLRRQVERDGLTRDEILAGLQAIADEAAAAHQLAVTVFTQ